MRARRLIGALFSAIVATGCLQSTVLVRINGDGSGTIENQTLMAPAALAQMRQLAGLFGAGRKLDEGFYEELETVLLTSDVGVTATEFLISNLRARASPGWPLYCVLVSPRVMKQPD